MKVVKSSTFLLLLSLRECFLSQIAVLDSLLHKHWYDSAKYLPVLCITWEVQVNWLAPPPYTVTIQLSKEESVSCEIHLFHWLAAPWHGRNPRTGQVYKRKKKGLQQPCSLEGHDRNLTMKIKGSLWNIITLTLSYSMCLLWWASYCFMFSIYSMAAMASVLFSHQ